LIKIQWVQINQITPISTSPVRFASSPKKGFNPKDQFGCEMTLQITAAFPERSISRVELMGKPAHCEISLDSLVLLFWFRLFWWECDRIS